MKTIYRKWNCYNIAANEQYIAAFGEGVTVLKRDTLELVHHFTGMRSIHGGLFVGDDVIFVHTGEQKFYFLSVKDKSVIWNPKRPSQLRNWGGIRAVSIPGTTQVACIGRGKSEDMREHYLVILDVDSHSVALRPIPDCYRVVGQLICSENGVLSFITSMGCDGLMTYRVISMDLAGNVIACVDWSSREIVDYYCGTYLFARNTRDVKPYLRYYSRKESGYDFAHGSDLPVPVFRFQGGPVGSAYDYVPHVNAMDDSGTMVVACASDWIGVIALVSGKLLLEESVPYIYCGKIIDNRLLIGCAKGLHVVSMD